MLLLLQQEAYRIFFFLSGSSAFMQFCIKAEKALTFDLCALYNIRDKTLDLKLCFGLHFKDIPFLMNFSSLVNCAT